MSTLDLNVFINFKLLSVDPSLTIIIYLCMFLICKIFFIIFFIVFSSLKQGTIMLSKGLIKYKLTKFFIKIFIEKIMVFYRFIEINKFKIKNTAKQPIVAN